MLYSYFLKGQRLLVLYIMNFSPMELNLLVYGAVGNPCNTLSSTMKYAYGVNMNR